MCEYRSKLHSHTACVIVCECSSNRYDCWCAFFALCREHNGVMCFVCMCILNTTCVEQTHSHTAATHTHTHLQENVWTHNWNAFIGAGELLRRLIHSRMCAYAYTSTHMRTAQIVNMMCCGTMYSYWKWLLWWGVCVCASVQFVFASHTM